MRAERLLAGIALAPTDASDSETLLRCADAAMYRARVAERVVDLLEVAEVDEQVDRGREG